MARSPVPRHRIGGQHLSFLLGLIFPLALGICFVLDSGAGDSDRPQVSDSSLSFDQRTSSFTGQDPPKQLDVVVAASVIGTAESFGGGEQSWGALSEARDQINRILPLIEKGVYGRTACEPLQCLSVAGHPSLCPLLRALSSQQKEECNYFLTSRAAELIAVNQDAVTPLILSSVPLTAPALDGSRRAVAALTKRTARGDILFHLGSLRSLGRAELVALLGHELGHKLRGEAKGSDFLDDFTPCFGFSSGQSFLNAIGAAMALFAEEHPRIASEPPPLPGGILNEEVCNLISAEGTKWTLGVAISALSTIPDHALLTRLNHEVWGANGDGSAVPEPSRRESLVRRWLELKPFREALVRMYFHRYLGREPSLPELQVFWERFASGGSQAQALAAILGDEEYLRKNGSVALNLSAIDTIFRAVTRTTPSDGETSKLLGVGRELDGSSLAYLVLTGSDFVQQHLASAWVKDWLNREATSADLARAREKLGSEGKWEDVEASLLSSNEFVELQRKRWENCSSVANRK